MSRFNILISALVLGCIAGHAQFSVKLNSSQERRIVSDGSFAQDASTSSGFTFGGIDVADIDEISSSTLAQDAAGTMVTLPDGISSRKRAAILDLNSATGENESEKRHLYSCLLGHTSLDEAISNSSLLNPDILSQKIAEQRGYC